MLLQHASGLENYPDVLAYRPDRVYTPAEAVSLSTRSPLRSVPGTAVWYSNSNYLWLGLLLEQVSGRPLADLVAERIAAPLGLRDTTLDVAARPGWAGQGSGALSSTATDLVRFSTALFDEGRLLGSARLEDMLDVGALNVGLGTWPMCPCGTDAAGNKEYAGVGHTNAWGGVYWYPAERLSLFVRIDPPPPDIGPVFGEVADVVLAAAHEGNAS